MITPEIEKFIIWLQNGDWWYNPIKKLWIDEGYTSRTTGELFEYWKFKLKKYYGIKN